MGIVEIRFILGSGLGAGWGLTGITLTGEVGKVVVIGWFVGVLGSDRADVLLLECIA